MKNAINNEVKLIGRLGKDVELKTFDSGMKKATFRLATNTYVKDKNGEVKVMTDWHTIVSWGMSAELMSKALNKGVMVAINGSLRYTNYNDKNGIEHRMAEVIATNFLVLDDKEKNTTEPKQARPLSTKDKMNFKKLDEAPIAF